MEKSFSFFSDSLNLQLDVEVEINANEDEAWIDKLTIYDENGEKVPENSLTPDELRAINTEADALASNHASEAYQDRLERLGDFAYDQMRDAEMLDSNSHFSEEMHNEMDSSFLDEKTLASMADELMNEPDGYMISEDENN